MQSKAKRPVPLVFIMLFTAMISATQLWGGFVPVYRGAANSLVLIVGLLYVAMGVGGFAAVIGLWLYQSWANLLTRIIYIISIPIGLFAMYMDRSGSNVAMQLLNIVLDVWIIWYLMRPQTKALFTQAKK
jgi:uncharacterized membrane protein (DUF2068 family)